MFPGSRFIGCLAVIIAAAILHAQPERKQKKANQKDPVTQTLPLLPDPPLAIAAEPARLIFHVSPLSAKGLLSQQTHDALKALERDNHGAQIVKLRAFVAGTGDMRRVQQIVSELFSEKKLPLPVLTTVQVGALPLEGAQVVIESVAMDKRPVNPGGLMFLPPQPVEALKRIDSVVRVTCYLNSLDDLAEVRGQVSAEFPSAATNFFQLNRLGGVGGPGKHALCDAVARSATAPPGGAVSFTGPKIILSGLQMAFSAQESDAHLAFDRLSKSVQPLGGRVDRAFVSIYALTGAAASAIHHEWPGASSAPVLLFEGLPSLDALVGVDIVAPAE